MGVGPVQHTAHGPQEVSNNIGAVRHVATDAAHGAEMALTFSQDLQLQADEVRHNVMMLPEELKAA